MRPNGTAIRALRMARNMSLRSFQDTTGYNRGYLSRVERGLIADVADSKVLGIAAALGVPTAAITYDTPKETT